MKTVGVVLIWVLAVLTLGYFLPLAIAFQRTHKDTLAIFLLDLFLGWTLIGWVVAIVWSVKKDDPIVVTQPVAP